MNPGFKNLQPYPFEKLGKLFSAVEPPAGKSAINLSIGEPRHETPAFILEELKNSIGLAAKYPPDEGENELRQAICEWLQSRFSLPAASLDPGKHVIPVNGTREALFAICQCIVDREQENPLVITGNPFYQIYEGAAVLAGASPCYLNCTAENGFIADYASVSKAVWQRTQLVYLCSPNNPTGSVIELDTLKQLMELSDEYDFVIASDECYSEIYLDESLPPVGLLEAASKLGRTDFHNCLVFHSLSKRSNVPGIRSGFVAGDEKLIEAFYQYRTYHGCAMAPYTQRASILAWQDEEHVIENRRLYREKIQARKGYTVASGRSGTTRSDFYLWPRTEIADTEFARGLYQQENVTVLPGSYLSREIDGINPGDGRLRIALVASLEECEEAAMRITRYVKTI